jgi:hypothetical protein
MGIDSGAARLSDLRRRKKPPPGLRLRGPTQALELDSENLGPVYSSAFLLEREGRLQEAVDAWQFIIEWSEERGFTQDVEWPRQEIKRLRGKPPGVPEGSPA